MKKIPTLCEIGNHDWGESISKTYRRCQREGCDYAEHVNGKGEWVILPPKRKKEEKGYAQLKLF